MDDAALRAQGDQLQAEILDIGRSVASYNALLISEGMTDEVLRTALCVDLQRWCLSEDEE